MNQHRSELRHVLQGAINAREAAMRNGRSLRKDHDRVRVAIGRAEAFLRSYPTASDERVLAWCREHLQDVTLIVPGNTPRVLARLIMDGLRGRTMAA